MFFLLSKTLDLAFAPLSWALVLLAWGLWLSRRRHKHAQRLLVAALLMVYLPATAAVSVSLWRAVERFDARQAPASAKYDAVILLGGFAWQQPSGVVEYADGVDRLFRAWELLRDGRAARVIITANEAETPAIAKALEELGVSRRRMLLDSESMNTRDNAVYTQALAKRYKLQSLVLVTSAFHMQRAVECFRALGIDPDVIATDHGASGYPGWFDLLAPRSEELRRSELALREFAGRLIYRARGYARSKP